MKRRIAALVLGLAAAIGAATGIAVSADQASSPSTVLAGSSWG